MAKFVDNLKYYMSKTNRFHRALFMFALMGLRIVPGGKVGFYCNDPALSFPYTGDTINFKWLLAICLLLPLVIMLIVERWYNNGDKEKSNRRALRWYKEYGYGFLLNLLVIQLLKVAVGSPRPHFFDTCKPNEATTCEGSDYVPYYTCSKPQWQWHSDTSFPSGHTSLAVHGGFFISYYIHRRLSHTSVPHVLRLIQVLSIAGTTWCSISRITDHRHHWWDVLAGLAIGFVILIYTTHYLCRNFECATKSDVITNEISETSVPLIKTTVK